MQGVAALPSVVAAPRGLAINGDDVGVTVAQAADPGLEAGLEQRRVQGCEHVAWPNAAFITVEAPEERQMLGSPQRRLDELSCDGGSRTERSAATRRHAQATGQAVEIEIGALQHADLDFHCLPGSLRVAPGRGASLSAASTIAGADDFVETTLWGTEHLAFLRRFYRYESGIPSHDTLCDVFAALDPALFKACFQAWISGLRDGDADIIAIDGKTSRRSHDRRKRRNPLHLVSAWAARQRIVLFGDLSELYFEWPMTSSASRTNQVFMFNHPAASSVLVSNSDFTTDWMDYHTPSFDSTTMPHGYTTCYDDAGSGRLTRYVDGVLMYSAVWKWNASLGGTGHGRDSIMTMSLAVGGSWPGNVANPAGYVGDLDVY